MALSKILADPLYKATSFLIFFVSGKNLKTSTSSMLSAYGSYSSKSL